VFLLILVSLLFLFSTPIQAELNICKFSSQTTSDKIDVCNTSDTPIDLSLYSITDSGTNTKKLSENQCFLSPNNYISIGFSRYLDNAGDLINLKKEEQIVDCVSYGDVTCVYDGIHVDVANDMCNKLTDDQWQTTNECDFLKENNCILPTITPSPTVIIQPSPTPTSTPLPTNTTTPTPTTISQSIYIDSAPSSPVSPNQTFSLQFTIHNPDPNFEYKLKVVYGSGNESDKTCLVKTVYPDNTILNFNSPWSSFPIYKSSDSNTLSGTIKAVLSDCTNGSTLPDSLSIKIKSENDILSQNLKYIDIKKDPSSTPKPTSTTKPSSTPYPTSTPKPTLTPTLSISPSPTDTITDTPTPEPSPEILGEYDDISETISFITPTASPSAKTNHVDIFGIIPYFLITAGGGLLLTPTLITKFKK